MCSRRDIKVVVLVIITASVLVEYPFRTFAERLIFPHESCEVATINNQNFVVFHPLQDSQHGNNGTITLKVRFKGVADGYVAFTQNQNASLPHYVILFGTYNNQKSEIRKSRGGTNYQNPSQATNTHGIMSPFQYRGFILRYHRPSGAISVLSEGNEIPLLYLQDPDPLDVRYFSFATWHNRVVMASFNCQPGQSNDPQNANSSSKEGT